MFVTKDFTCSMGKYGTEKVALIMLCYVLINCVKLCCKYCVMFQLSCFSSHVYPAIGKCPKPSDVIGMVICTAGFSFIY